MALACRPLGTGTEPKTTTSCGSDATSCVRNNGDCGTGRITFVLTRKPGQPGFEGENHRDTSTAQITLGMVGYRAIKLPLAGLWRDACYR